MRAYWDRIVAEPVVAIGLIVVGGFIGFAALSPFLLIALNLYIDPSLPSDKRDLVQAFIQIGTCFVQIVGGLVLLAGLAYTGRTLQINRQTLRHSVRVLEVNVQAQLADRFSKAIDQLGAGRIDRSIPWQAVEGMETRLGAIYSLEQVAHDSDRLYGPVFEILTAYVGLHARCNPDPREAASQLQEAKKVEPRPDLDIEAILNVIRRRRIPPPNIEQQPLSLTRCDLRFGTLTRAHLKGVDFRSSRLVRAGLTDADLSFVGPRRPHDDARLERAWLHQAHMADADLTRAHFDEAVMEQAYLVGATLVDADLWRAQLQGAFLENADLRGAVMTGAILTGADLSGANLLEAKGLTQAQLDEAYMDPTTQLPPGFRLSPLRKEASKPDQSAP